MTLSRRLLLIAAPLFGVGAILAIAGWMMGGKTSMVVNVRGYDMNVGISGIYGTRNNGTLKVSDDQALAPFTVLDVDVRLGDVFLVPSDHYGLELKWHDEGNELRYENEDGKLRVWSPTRINVGANINVGPHGPDASVTVYFPKGAKLDQLIVKTALGQAELSGFSADKADVKADLGKVTVSEATVGDGTFRLSLGDLHMDNITAKTLDLTLSMGNLEGYGLTTKERLTVENSMGRVDLQGRFEGKTMIDNSMGDVAIATDLKKADYSYDLRTSMGKVQVDGERSEKKAVQRGGSHTIDVKNSMGDVRVDFLG